MESTDVESLESERDVDGLIAALHSSASSGREAAARALGHIGDRRALEPLLECLGDWVWGVQSAACDALGMVGDVRALPRLATVLTAGKGDAHTVARAAVALGQIGDPLAVPALTAALGDERRPVGLGTTATPALAAIEALRAIGDEQGVEPLVAVLSSDRSNDIRAAAARALGTIAGDRAVAALIAALDDAASTAEDKWTDQPFDRTGDYTQHTIESSYPVREAAAAALKTVGSPDAIRALESAPPATESEQGWAR